MYKDLINHEKYILKIILDENILNLNKIIEYHLNQIIFFQHERLIHLLVTLSTGIILIGLFVAAIISSNTLLYFATLITIVTEIFYIIHYYRMENGVQRLYKLYNQLKEKEYKL